MVHSILVLLEECIFLHPQADSPPTILVQCLIDTDSVRELFGVVYTADAWLTHQSPPA